MTVSTPFLQAESFCKQKENRKKQLRNFIEWLEHPKSEKLARQGTGGTSEVLDASVFSST